MRVLELFSGIGGMHVALQESGIPFEVVAAIDININANCVYNHNFPDIKLLSKNIQSISVDYINKLRVEMILMSPPCQPFTRLGNKKDLTDNRSNALSHLIQIIPKLEDKLKYILLENVRGFETSDAREKFVESLEEAKFEYREFILNSLQFGVPNSRERYYLIAKRRSNSFVDHLKPDVLLYSIPGVTKDRDEIEFSIKDILDQPDTNSKQYKEYLVPLADLEKRCWILDIVTKESRHSCCFTKGYTHYYEGAGSVYCPYDAKKISEVFAEIEDMDKERESLAFYQQLESLKLRFFSSTEVKRLMSFPEYFTFPSSITKRQKYKLLGNSINVKVVSELIKLIMCNEKYF